ncbi:MAG: phage holin family protein [Coriobacteriales bacterium]|jgi:putative membrane protein|nr:phage holin family protein [Coriobacteriales bacterium]
MGKLIGIWLITVVAVAAAFTIVPGIGFIDSGFSLNAPGILGSSVLIPTLIFSAVLALVNTFFKPILQVISLPITIITLGIFALVINVLMLYLASWLSNTFFDTGFVIANFFSALVASIIISIVTAILGLITGVDSKKKKHPKKN